MKLILYYINYIFKVKFLDNDYNNHNISPQSLTILSLFILLKTTSNKYISNINKIKSKSNFII